jgi:hypothetical protein
MSLRWQDLRRSLVGVCADLAHTVGFERGPRR